MALLADKTAVVTGAASGNGRGISEKLAEHGADVVVADIREIPRGGGSPTHELINENTDSVATFVECDVTEEGDLESAVSAADEFGGVDIMVNNAGFGRTEEFTELSEEMWDEMMDVNLRGVFLGSKVALGPMREQESGNIINISSVSGLKGSPNSPTYSASKGGVMLLTYSIAANYGPENIRANAIHPGPIGTSFMDDIGWGPDMLEDFRQEIPLRRVGEPEDIGDAAVLLSSDLASWITGTSLVVDGGYLSKL